MTYYLKYRSQTLDELDLTDVRENLKKLVATANLPHAFLFSGPKGTGKTSTARIVAKIVNCESTSVKVRGNGLIEPCNTCEQCLSITRGSNLDVVELDAASNRGIDDVRALRDTISLAPSRAKKKIYILDEAHMLTSEASNALLKTLEEPPDHVIFILATTNPEKLIPTILSRVVSIKFAKATETEIVRSLDRIVRGEKLKIDNSALVVVAKNAKGSFRDAAKNLEYLITSGAKLDKTSVEELFFKSSAFDLENFFTLLAAFDAKGAIQIIETAVNQGLSATEILETILTSLHTDLLAQVVGQAFETKFDKTSLIYLIELFFQASLDTKNAIIDQLPIELAIVKWVEFGDTKDKKVPVAPSQEKPNETGTSERLATAILSDDIWSKILSTVRPINTSIEALLRASKPLSFDGKILNLGVFYKFHKERLEDNHHRRVLEDVAASVLGVPVRINCTLTEPITTKMTSVQPQSVLVESENSDVVKIAEEIFGS